MDNQTAARSLGVDRDETVERIAALTTDLEGVAAASAGSNLDDEHDPEGSTVAFERAQLTAVLVQSQIHLADVDVALERLSRDRYGLCERCRNPIAEERLATLPAARRCIGCTAQ